MAQSLPGLGRAKWESGSKTGITPAFGVVMALPWPCRDRGPSCWLLAAGCWLLAKEQCLKASAGEGVNIYTTVRVFMPC